MDKMWAGRFSKSLDKVADDFNQSIHIDKRMYRQDIYGSLAHVKMLGKCNIISGEDCKTITEALKKILEDIESGTVKIDENAEDIHMFIESLLTERTGDTGKKLHTARSRNDQVAVDIRLYLKEECAQITGLIRILLAAIYSQAEKHKETVVPGYTHLQRAQPIMFAHHLLAYAMMFIRDIGRIEDAVKRMNCSPLGSCALAGTTYNTDRAMTAELLGFDGVSQNSIDGVSDRDFCIELLGAFSTVMMHLSRFSEEIILWSSWEFKFIELDDAYTTGSSIMPQKKNSDMAELVRGKSGRVYGDLMATLTMLKGLPLAYNKDMQEDKEAIFDGVDTVKKCLEVFAPMIETMRVNKQRMYSAAQEGFINATDLADYMVKKGIPFRSAYKTVGQIVAKCIEDNCTLEAMPIEKYKEFDPIFENDLYAEIDLLACAQKRTSEGGTSVASVNKQLEYVKKML